MAHRSMTPKPFVRAFIAHREEREAQILACIDSGLETIDAMVPKMYQGTPEFLFPAAARSVFAAMEYLVARGALQCDGPPTLKSHYRRA